MDPTPKVFQKLSAIEGRRHKRQREAHVCPIAHGTVLAVPQHAGSTSVCTLDLEQWHGLGSLPLLKQLDDPAVREAVRNSLEILSDWWSLWSCHCPGLEAQGSSGATKKRRLWPQSKPAIGPRPMRPRPAQVLQVPPVVVRVPPPEG